jgi:uncharacterized protein YndB with AHSA1/START domain
VNARREVELTTSERASDRELVVRRTFDAPARLVFQAWTTPELLKKWWVPRSIGMDFLSCEADVRTGGSYRFVFRHPQHGEAAFFGKYVEVVPNAKIVWTNEEGGADGSVTTLTLEEKNGKTLLVITDRYPSKEALDAAIASGSTAGFDEQFVQLDGLLSKS